MAESQRVAQYASDSDGDNDMQSESTNNGGVIKQKSKRNRRK
jgi:hypothetical protein